MIKNSNTVKSYRILQILFPTGHTVYVQGFGTPEENEVWIAYEQLSLIVDPQEAKTKVRFGFWIE